MLDLFKCSAWARVRGGKVQEVTNFPLLTKEGTDPRRPSEVWLGQSIQHIEPSSSRQIIEP